MPKVVNREERMSEIAGVALRLFSRDGYGNTGMRKIAEEMEVSKTQLYHYFKKKSDLLDYCFHYLLGQATGFNTEELQALSPAKRVDVLIDYYSRVIREFQFEKFFISDYERDKEIPEAQKQKNLLGFRKTIQKSLQNIFQVNSRQAEKMQTVLVGALYLASYSKTKLNKTITKELFQDILEQN